MTVGGLTPARPDAQPTCLRGRADTGSVAIGFRRGTLMRSLGLALLACLAVAACSTQRQTVGTAAGVAAGPLWLGLSARWWAVPWAQPRPLQAPAIIETATDGC